MFDLRYHVASLAAVFLALLIGIVVGVGISRSTFVSESERLRFEERIARLRADLADTQRQVRAQEAAGAFVTETYPAVMSGRLADRRVAVVFVGSVDPSLRAVDQTLDDSDGRRLRLRAIKVPLDTAAIDAALPDETGALRLRGRDRLDDLGRLLGEELVVGGETPIWDALAELMVEEQAGSTTGAADAVVVVRSADRQAGDTARFLSGLYNGLASAGVPAVAVETTSEAPAALGVFANSGFSTVNNVDTPAGRLALAVLLAGDSRGRFGVAADDGYLPRIPPITARATSD